MECFSAVQEIILHALQLITDQKDLTNSKHQQMQESFSFQPKNAVHAEESFDSQSVISSTSGIVSVSDSNESLFRRVESINERTNILKQQIKNQPSSHQRTDFTEFNESDFSRSFTKSANNQQYVAKTSVIEVDSRNVEVACTSDHPLDQRASQSLSVGRLQSRFDSTSSSSCSVSSAAPVTVRNNEEISLFDDLFSKSSEPMQEVDFFIFYLFYL